MAACPISLAAEEVYFRPVDPNDNPQSPTISQVSPNPVPQEEEKQVDAAGINIASKNIRIPNSDECSNGEPDKIPMVSATPTPPPTSLVVENQGRSESGSGALSDAISVTTPISQPSALSQTQGQQELGTGEIEVEEEARRETEITENATPTATPTSTASARSIVNFSLSAIPVISKVTTPTVNPTLERFEKTFDTLIQRTEAWEQVIEEIQQHIQELHAHEKMTAAALKKLAATVSSVDIVNTEGRSVVNAIGAVCVQLPNSEAEHHNTFAKHLGSAAAYKLSAISQDTKKRSRLVNEKKQSLWGELQCCKEKLAEQRVKFTTSELIKESMDFDPWLIEKQMIDEVQREKHIYCKIPPAAIDECQSMKEFERQRNAALKSLLLSVVESRKQTLVSMLKDVEITQAAVEKMNSDGDWQHFVARFPSLHFPPGMKLPVFAEPPPPPAFSSAILKRGCLKRQGMFFGTSEIYLVISKFGFLHQFTSEKCMTLEASYKLAPGLFVVNAVTPESFEFTHKQVQSPQSPSVFGNIGFKSLFGGVDTKLLLYAQNKDEMVAWMTTLYDFSRRKKTST